MIRVIKFVEDPYRVRELEVNHNILSAEDHEILSDYVCTYMMSLDAEEGEMFYIHRKGMLEKAKKAIFLILHQICRKHKIEFKFFKSIYLQDDVLYVKL